MTAKKKLGELLLEAEAITHEDLLRALEEQATTGERLGSVLVRLRIVDSGLLSRMLGEQHAVDPVELSSTVPTAEALARIPADLAMRYGCLPLWIEDSTLAVAMLDPLDEAVLGGLKAHTGLEIRRLVAPQSALYAAIKQFYGPLISPLDVRELRRHLKNLKDDIARLEALIG